MACQTTYQAISTTGRPLAGLCVVPVVDAQDEFGVLPTTNLQKSDEALERLANSLNHGDSDFANGGSYLTDGAMAAMHADRPISEGVLL
ncbi:hypothetical protein [Celeribacter litoreus]|uniref:hypothetical protein n=1 Tax=Celeribacter litoreus TaxID=2876714 RepID=UPI001CCDFA8C|nr:hypothetical protein [Celeribacter litoreus]MCA0045266.1 hypothetical protein [Celeribacter litoreus]